MKFLRARLLPLLSILLVTENQSLGKYYSNYLGASSIEQCSEKKDTRVSNLTKQGGTGAKGVTIVIPKGKLANHIFSGRAGKLVDSPTNRKLITEIVNDSKYFQGVDKYGKSWFTKTLKDGTQIYGYTQNGIVKGAGINETPVNLIQRYNLK